jgi:Holliday junction resolvase RusA-like endonuclease
MPDVGDDDWVGLYWPEREPLVELSRLNEKRIPDLPVPAHFSFFVAGRPKTQGNMTSAVVAGKPRIWEKKTPELQAWRHAIATEARQCVKKRTGLESALAYPAFVEGPVSVSLFFWMEKPKSAPKRKRIYPTKRGLDIDKAARAGLDALTGVLFMDDSQVIRLIAEKDFLDPIHQRFGPGVMVTVTEYRR